MNDHRWDSLEFLYRFYNLRQDFLFSFFLNYLVDSSVYYLLIHVYHHRDIIVIVVELLIYWESDPKSPWSLLWWDFDWWRTSIGPEEDLEAIMENIWVTNTIWLLIVILFFFLSLGAISSWNWGNLWQEYRPINLVLGIY